MDYFRHNDDGDNCNLLIFVNETKTMTNIQLTADDN